MRLTVFVFLVFAVPAFPQSPCDTCVDKFAKDPAGPVAQFIQIAKDDPLRLDAPQKAQWCLCRLALELCGACMDADTKEAMQECMRMSEINLANMAASIPLVEFNAYRSRVSPLVLSGAQSGTPGNDPVAAPSSGGQPPPGGSLAGEPSFEEKVRQIEAKKDPAVAAKKRKAVDAKIAGRADVMRRYRSAVGMTCGSGATSMMSGTALSGIMNSNSLDGSVSWSVWKTIPGTQLEIRFSKKKNCVEPEFPNTIDFNENLKYVAEGSDQFFDYGFLQLRNLSPQTVKGKLALLTAGDEITHSEDWPFFLEGHTEMAESIGNWYIGCEIISVAVKEYCK